MQELGEHRPETSLGWRIARFASLAVAFLAFDFFMSLLWELSSGGEMEFPQGAYIGLFVTQINLIAFWVALGTGRMIVRIPWALLGITLIYIVHQWGASRFLSYRVSASDQSLLATILLFGLIANTVSLIVYRVAARRRLAYQDLPTEVSNRFHLWHLIVGMSIFSVTLAMLNAFGWPVAIPSTGNGNLPMGLGIAAIINLTITVPVIAVAFHVSQQSWSWVSLLGGVCATISIGEMVVLCLALGMPPDFLRAFFFVLLINFTQCFVLLLSFLLVRSSGFELRHVTNNATIRSTAEEPRPVVAQADPWSDDEET